MRGSHEREQSGRDEIFGKSEISMNMSSNRGVLVLAAVEFSLGNAAAKGVFRHHDGFVLKQCDRKKRTQTHRTRSDRERQRDGEMPLDLSPSSSDDERTLGGENATTTSSIAQLRARLELEKERKRERSGLDAHDGERREEQQQQKQRHEEERVMLKGVIGSLSEENARLMEEMKTMMASASSSGGGGGNATNRSENEDERGKQILLLEKRAKEFQRQKELAERARGEDSTRLSQKLMDVETIKNRFQSQLRECREALETKEKELKRLREHLLDVEEAEDRDEMSIEERVEEEKRRVEEKFEKEVERLSMQLMEKEDGLNRKIKEVENLNRALGSFYADQEQMDGRTNEAKEARQKLRETSGKLRETMELLEKKTMEMEELERKRGRAEEKFKDASRKCAEATAQSTKLRVALTQAIKKIARLSSSSAGCDDGENEVFIDKSVITKLLVTYFERNFSEEVLELMSRLLNMEDSQREAIVLGARRATGVISKVARAPLGIARGVGKAFGAISGVGLRVVGATGENAEVPVADLFIDFLLKEAEEELNNNDASTAEEEEKENSTPLPKSPSSERGGIFSAVDVE